jgi:hypothetical protein
MPSLRIAVDLKVELFHNVTKIWTMNAIHDIDALSLAVPYCHAVVPGREMPHLLARSRSGERCGSQIARHLNELPGMLPELVSRPSPPTVTGPAGTGQARRGFCLDTEKLRRGLPGQPPTA